MEVSENTSLIIPDPDEGWHHNPRKSPSIWVPGSQPCLRNSHACASRLQVLRMATVIAHAPVRGKPCLISMDSKTKASKLLKKPKRPLLFYIPLGFRYTLNKHATAYSPASSGRGPLLRCLCGAVPKLGTLNPKS